MQLGESIEHKSPQLPQSLQLREALNCKEANGPTGRKDPKFVKGGKWGAPKLSCFINKNTDCEKTRKGKI